MININNFRNLIDDHPPQRFQKKIEALLRDITQETWDDAHSIILDGHGTVWQYVCEVDNTYAWGHSENTPWILPTPLAIRKAIELAHDNCIKGLWLVCGKTKVRPF